MEQDRELAEIACQRGLLTRDELAAAEETQKLLSRPLLAVLHDLDYLTLLQIDFVRQEKYRTDMAEQQAAAKAEAERKARDEAERREREAAERRAREEAERKQREEAERKRREEEERRQREETERAAREEAERREREEAERREREAAEAKRREEEAAAKAAALPEAEDEIVEELPAAEEVVAEAEPPSDTERTLRDLDDVDARQQEATEAEEAAPAEEEAPAFPDTGMGDLTMLDMRRPTAAAARPTMEPEETLEAEEVSEVAEEPPPAEAADEELEPVEEAFPGGVGDHTMLDMGNPRALAEMEAEQGGEDAVSPEAEESPRGRGRTRSAADRLQAPKSGGCGKKAAMLLLALGGLLLLMAFR